jgi:hypothetical protein
MSIANFFNQPPPLPVELSDNIINLDGIAVLDATQTFTGVNTFNAVTNFNSSISMSGNALTLNNATPNIIMQNSGTGNYYLIRSNTNPGQSTILSLYDPGTSNCNLQLGVANFVTISGATTITVAQSGCIFNVINNISAAYTITLPSTPINGLYYKFIIGENLNEGAITITSTPLTDNIIGNYLSSDGTAVTHGNLNDGCTNIILGTTTIIGDSLEIWCNGYWVVRGITSVHGSVTFS